LVGENNNGSVFNCSSTGPVTGKNYNAGGLIGNNYYGSVSASYSTGAVTGDWDVGGLVGENYRGDIVNCHSGGAVAGSGQGIGGLVGCNFGTVLTCYSSGAVTGDDSVGGLVGRSVIDTLQGSAENSFWDIEASGLADSAGGTGLTTAEMQMANTFSEAGWDFVGETENGTEEVWWIDEGQDYPRLWWEAADAEF
jgi:hypothetical protein